jgi:hypothetical protein
VILAGVINANCCHGLEFRCRETILTGMSDRTASTRWYHLTPDRFVIILLAVEASLFACNEVHWLPKGYAVLITAVVVVAAMFFLALWFVDSVVYRRTFQFSIGALLLLTMAVAISCSWLAAEIRWAKKQRDELAAIDNMTVTLSSMQKGKVYSSQDKIGSYSYPVDELGWPAYWPRHWLGDDFFISVESIWFVVPEKLDGVYDVVVVPERLGNVMQ